MVKRLLVIGALAILAVTGLVLVPADPALARTSFHFGLNLGVPVAPYPAYAYPYPPAGYYAPAPYYRVYPPCVRVWTPGYYDPYGNWVFGYYRYDCSHYGY
jgi:hypothetical protein